MSGIRFTLTDDAGNHLAYDAVAFAGEPDDVIATLAVTPSATITKARTPRRVSLTLAELEALGAVVDTTIALVRAVRAQQVFADLLDGDGGD